MLQVQVLKFERGFSFGVFSVCCCVAGQKFKTDISTEASEMASENICICAPICPVKYRTFFTFVSSAS